MAFAKIHHDSLDCSFLVYSRISSEDLEIFPIIWCRKDCLLHIASRIDLMLFPRHSILKSKQQDLNKC